MSADEIKGFFLTTAAAATAASIAYLQRQLHGNYDSSALLPVSSSKAPQSVHTTGVSLLPKKGEYETYPIDFQMHVEHRNKAINTLKQLIGTDITHGAILIHGGVELNHYDTDTTYAFRQESFFQYLFGVREPGCAGLILLDTKETILFIPRTTPDHELWCGPHQPMAWYQSYYQVSQVHYVDELTSSFLLQFYPLQILYLLKGTNPDSGLETTNTSSFPGIEDFELNTTLCYPALVTCRMIKTSYELDVLRYVNTLASQAHIQVMQHIQPGQMEYHAESLFLHYCYSYGGARACAYTCICGSGTNASILHYGHANAPNDAMLKDGDLFLNDMGVSYHGYASDITCTFPINGRFTLDQKKIYEGVLKAHDAVLQAIQPGESYVTLHLLSHRVLTQHLLEIGLFQNGTVDELMDHEISSYFYPHGLGHFMGIDVHDVGGYLGDQKRSSQRILSKLRNIQILQSHMVFTVEPGCYFIPGQLKVLQEQPTLLKFINQELLGRFIGMGGIRIESNVIVTLDGYEMMTKVPRTIEEIEKVMNSWNDKEM